MRDRVATLYLSLVMVLSVFLISGLIGINVPFVSGGNPDDIASIETEADPDFLVVGHSSNISIWLYDSGSVGIEGIADSIILNDDEPGSNPDGWFSDVFEQGKGLYNATYYAPSTSDPNVIIKVSNTHNVVFGTKTIILVDSGGQVEIKSSYLHVDDVPFYIQGLSYAPTYNGSDKYDNNAVQFDIPRIADANVNTIRLYVANRYYWGGQSWTDAITSTDVTLDFADLYDIKVIMGFWADETIDWTDQEVRDNQTAAWQEMVNRYMDAEPVLMWALGNEVLNNMDSANKTSYAQWMESMAQWTHANEPNHPVTYSDAGIGEINTLKNNVPSLDIYSFNHYDFEDALQFQSVLDTINSLWPKPVLLNEYGSDSRDNDADEQDQTKHAERLQTLYEAVEDEMRDYAPGFLGSLWFEWTDQWNFEGSSDVQDPGTWWGWSPTSCFDSYADLEYFGIASCVDQGMGASRELREAYWTLKSLYENTTNNVIELSQGWNLISIPFIQSDSNLQTVLESIEGSYDAMQWYDASDMTDPWKYHKVSKSFGNDLAEIDENMGFLIHITQPGVSYFIFNGTPSILNQSIPLMEGWNLVGYPSLTSYSRAEGLDNLEFGIDVDAVWWYDTLTDTWHFMDIDDQFIPGRGYWIHSKVEATWVVSL
jgi:hypothetical protein